jgi:NAD(P)H-hydrate epimerase
MYLVTASEMQEMDRRTIETFGIPGRVLMENAGRGTTDFLIEQFPHIASLRVGIIAGRGNNGGDGFVIARYLAQRDVDVTVYLLAETAGLGGDAAANFELLALLGVSVIVLPDSKTFDRAKDSLRDRDLWVDAILGTGLKSDVRGYYREAIDFINSLAKPVLSVDVPSGLNADNGQPCGTSIRACATATFAFAKTGHCQHPGAELTGKLRVIDIGIPPHIAEEVGPKQFLLTPDDIRGYLRPRPPNTHKGRAGHMFVLAGSPGKTGAAAMAALAAMRAGAGLVTLGVPQSLEPIVATHSLEVMTAALPETNDGVLGEASLDAILRLLQDKRCLALGPGMGQTDETRSLVHQLLAQCRLPLVIDADGLNNIAGATDKLRQCAAPVVITPHPGEMARLVETSVKTVQANRIACARDFSQAFKVHIVLKGAGTVIAHPDGFVFTNSTGNPGMASGGMGDVLTGLIAGLIAQGFAVEAACHLGVYLHGAAADSLAAQKGPWGYLASDLMNRIPSEILSRSAHPDTVTPCEADPSDRCVSVGNWIYEAPQNKSNDTLGR